MRKMIRTLPILLGAGICQPKINYVPVKIEAPPEHLTPVPISDQREKTYCDLAVLATEHWASAGTVNA
jgi:hypothetical protein